MIKVTDLYYFFTKPYSEFRINWSLLKVQQILWIISGSSSEAMLSVKWTSPSYMIPKFFQKPSLVTLGSGVLISIVQTEVHCVFKKT